MKLQDSIETYIGHFRTEAKRVRRLRSDLHCKVLVVTMLDALARGRYPDPNTKNQDRFVKLVEEFKHSQRFYRYRCTLVHEYRQPGHGMEWGRGDKAPYYHSMMDSKGKKRWLELVYPTGWFLDLVSPLLKSLETYYTDNSINPYASYTFGSPWR